MLELGHLLTTSSQALWPQEASALTAQRMPSRVEHRSRASAGVPPWRPAALKDDARDGGLDRALAPASAASDAGCAHRWS